MIGFKFDVVLGDCLDVLRTMDDSSVDAVVTDPPYGLAFMGKAWDGAVPSVDVWQECLRVLKPGGHLLAFAGTRTQHRMACAIEDAGFEIRDMIAWVYGSGFPKSLDVSKAIDKAAGAERTEVIGTKLGRPGMAKDGSNQRNGFDSAFGGKAAGPMPTDITAPATDAAKQWQGFGTALKPALEPITVARKPFKSTVAANVLEHGTGALNIDGCRVGTEIVKSDHTAMLAYDGQNSRPWHKGHKTTTHENTGRWPANLIHDGSDEVVGLFPEAKGAVSNSSSGKTAGSNCYGVYGPQPKRQGRGDNGSAARFFYCAKASKRDRDEGLEEFEAKRTGAMQATADGSMLTGSGNERTTTRANNHPTVKPTDLMRYLVRLVTPPGGIVLDPFCGSGSTGKAAVLEGFEFIGIEKEEEYARIAEARIQAAGGVKHD